MLVVHESEAVVATVSFLAADLQAIVTGLSHANGSATG
jgi:hypothetical protein